LTARFSPFRLLKDFLGNDLPRKLSQLEQNVREKLESDNRRAHGPFTLTDVQTVSCRAQPWQFVRLNPAAAMRVTLPSPREPDAGWICLKNVASSTSNIEVRPIGGTVDFAATISMTAPLESLFLVPDREANNWCAIRSTADSIGIGLPGEVLTTVAGPALDWALIVNANIDAAAAIEVSKLEAGNDDDVLTTVAGVPTWQPASGGGYWADMYDPDLLGHSSFTYGSDTSHAVDGVNIWAKNTSNGTISIGLAANQGIKIAQTGATGSFFNSTPFVYIELPDMAAFAYGNGPWRIQVQYELVAGFTGVQFTNEIGMGIGSETGLPAMWNMAIVRKGSGAGTTNLDTLGALNLGAANTETALVAVGSNDVATMIFYPALSAEYAFSQYSSGFNPPAEPQGKIHHLTGSSSGGAVPAFVTNKFGSSNVNGYQVVLGINTGNGGSTLGTVYFKRLRVQQWVAGY